jgi:hypothetical protein
MADKRAIIEQIRGINFKLKILPILDYYQIDYTEHIEGRYRAICRLWKSLLIMIRVKIVGVVFLAI